jgi:glutamyl-tRNA reductase
MKVLLVGLNHRTAPVEVRESFSLPAERWGKVNEQLVQTPGVGEAVVLSTCNRTEVLGVAEDPIHALERVTQFLAAQSVEGLLEPRHLYQLHEADAALHLFRVASSLDSMVVGEAQILGQVKDAYRAAVRAQSCGPMLNRLFQHAFRAAKRIRTETGIGTSSVSVARIGVQLANELFESFDGKHVLLLGAGEMAESALVGLRDAGVGSVTVLNRTLETAQQLANRFGGHAAGLDQLEPEMLRADVVLASVRVEHPLLDRAVLERVLSKRGGRPLLLIDLGLPRNVDPAANDLENVYLYDLDDLDRTAEQGRSKRRGAVQAAEAILREEAEHFDRWRSILPIVPEIQRLLERADAVASEEAQRALARLGSVDEDTEAAVERLAEAVVRKLLHEPLVRLRGAAAEGTGIYYAEAVRRLFGLEEEE